MSTPPELLLCIFQQLEARDLARVVGVPNASFHYLPNNVSLVARFAMYGKM